MANPVTVPCPVGAWTKVATAVSYGNVVIKNTKPYVYLWAYRETGDAAPTLQTQGMSFSGPEVEIDHSSLVDVYIWATRDAGSVEVWL